jgi:hypothetical protein
MNIFLIHLSKNLFITNNKLNKGLNYITAYLNIVHLNLINVVYLVLMVVVLYLILAGSLFS